MAIYAALHQEIGIRGFIGVGTAWNNLDSIRPLAKSVEKLRCYFISGKNDFTLERSRGIQAVLEANGIACKEEFHPELGHEFPADFEKSFSQAIKFIFEK